ncbi:TPA: hypothetical protein N0F65_012309, partial [Lagenidium giganteum]
MGQPIPSVGDHKCQPSGTINRFCWAVALDVVVDLVAELGLGLVAEQDQDLDLALDLGLVEELDLGLDLGLDVELVVACHRTGSTSCRAVGTKVAHILQHRVLLWDALEVPADELITVAINRVAALHTGTHDNDIVWTPVGVGITTTAGSPACRVVDLFLGRQAVVTDLAVVEDDLKQIDHGVVRPEHWLGWRRERIHGTGEVGVDVVVDAVLDRRRDLGDTVAGKHLVSHRSQVGRLG